MDIKTQGWIDSPLKAKKLHGEGGWGEVPAAYNPKEL